MEKYLKIGDYFGGDLSVSSGTRERIVSAKGEVLATTPIPMVARIAAHSINTHDELVAMNKELLAVLEGVVGIVDDSDGVSGYHLNGDIAEWGEFEEIEMARDVIAKAKAAS